MQNRPNYPQKQFSTKYSVSQNFLKVFIPCVRHVENYYGLVSQSSAEHHRKNVQIILFHLENRIYDSVFTGLVRTSRHDNAMKFYLLKAGTESSLFASSAKRS